MYVIEVPRYSVADALYLIAMWYANAEAAVSDLCPGPWFWLGAHQPYWTWEGKAAGPLLVEARRFRDRWPTKAKARGRWRGEPQRATVPVFLDSGAFSEIKAHGVWTWVPCDYAAFARRAYDVLGTVRHVATQDWMCEPFMLAKTGLDVAEHQRRTVRSFLDLRDIDPGLPWMPTLQGFTVDDYLRCADAFEAAGVVLADQPLVGLGSVCRRSGTNDLVDVLSRLGAALPDVRLHGFGVKSDGVIASVGDLRSIDSEAWSMNGRKAWEMALRLALGIDAGARWPEVEAALAGRGDLIDIDLYDFARWKRETGETASVANSQVWAEAWRASQCLALSRSVLDRMPVFVERGQMALFA